MTEEQLLEHIEEVVAADIHASEYAGSAQEEAADLRKKKRHLNAILREFRRLNKAVQRAEENLGKDFDGL